MICLLFRTLAWLKQSHLNQALLSVAEGTSGWFRIYPVYSYHSLSLSLSLFLFLLYLSLFSILAPLGIVSTE